MLSLLLSILVFVVSVCCHVIVHRLLARWGIVTGKTIIVYLIGFLVLSYIVRFTSFPLTALWFYSLLVFSYLLYFLSFLSDGQSPSAKILREVRSHGPLSRREILNRFTNEELLGIRINKLLQSGFLSKVDDRFYVRPRGAAIARFFLFYRKLLKWDWGG